MAEKEGRILEDQMCFYFAACSRKDTPKMALGITRQEAINRIAKAIWETGYHEVLNVSFDELKTKSKKSKSRTFNDFYKLTMERAEAALHALLEKEDNK